MTLRVSIVVAAALLTLGSSAPAQQSNMTFFITSVGPGKGGDLGGLEGADRHCQTLAQAAGAGSRTWRAYLSTQAAGNAQPINARDRIGRGPWLNAKGVQIAKDVDDLHGNPNINRETGLSESGTPTKARGDSPNQHDMLTGSQADGRAFPPGQDRTCGNWTSSQAGNAMLGHHDRSGPQDTDAMKSWNASHPSRDCSQPGLVATGGNGLFYCFATN